MSKTRVPMNLIQQNVYVRDVSPFYDEKKDFLIDSYVSQDEVVKSDGLKVERTVQDYPITPDSVNSYADGTNYRNDISAAVARSAPGRNIGDVAALQELLTKSPSEVSAFFASALEKINASKVASDVEKVNNEVSDNG